MRSKRFFLMLVTLFTSLSLATAQRVVTGEVISSSDAEPVIGASVYVKDNPNIGVQTDINGRFSFEVPASARYIVVSYVGMKTQELLIESRKLIIYLDNDATTTDVVVVTGYGTTTKKAFTGAASSISDETVKARFDANPINALKGNMPGLTISNSSGQPGAPTTIFIRGRNSLHSGTQPLYVIDGVPIEAGVFGMRSREGVEISPLATLSMSDIENLTVLKDASATAIYGARAANGVIVITTKKGRAGFKLNFTTRLGGASMPVTSGSKRYRPVNDANLYREMLLESMANPLKYSKVTGFSGTYQRYYQDLSYGDNDADRLKFFNKDWWDGVLNIPATGGQATDWLKEVTRTGLLQNYSLDISGGGDNPRAPRYYVAFDYLNEDGLVIGKDLNRYSIRMNLSQEPYSFLKYGINTALSLTETNMGTSGGYFIDPITQAFMQNPFSPVREPDGSYNVYHTINRYNPVAIMSEHGNKNNQKQYRALVSPYITISFLDWLSFTSRYGLDAYLLDDFAYWSFYTGDGLNVNGLGQNGYFTNFYQTITNTLNINKSWEDHHLSALVGQEGQSTYFKDAIMESTNYPVKDLTALKLASKPGYITSSIRELRLLSFLSNAEYNYASRYYLSASLRADASSRFHKNSRWGIFYSVGGKWRIASEEFMKDAKDYVQELTIRTSWGTTGNQIVGTGWYAARGLYSFGYSYAGNPGMHLTQFENPDLKWERTRKFNFGFDTRFFNFLSLSIDYYHHMTTDMAFEVPLSKTVGNASWYENIGKLRNQGIEFELGFDVVQTEDISLQFSFTGAWNQNRIIKLSTNKPIEGTVTIVEPGKDIYSWRMKEWAGVDPATGVGLWWKNEEKEREVIDANGNKRTEKYTVINHDLGTTTNYNEAQKVDLGKASPDFQGGFRTSFSYKDFDFSILLNYQLGGKIYGTHLRYDEQSGSALGTNFSQYVADNRWKKPGDKALVPMLYDSRTTWSNYSSRFLMSSDFLKIQNIMLGYTIKEALPQIGVGAIRFFFSMDNVYTFVAKNYRGFDPSSVGANGFQWWNYPMAMKFTGGITITF